MRLMRRLNDIMNHTTNKEEGVLYDSHESELVEFKKSTSELKEAIISIVAILNKHKKGKLYFGLRNDGTCVGQHVTEATLREISQVISANIEPKIFPQIESIKIGGKDCVKVLFYGNEHPYFAYGRAYMRVADEDRQLATRELERIIVEKNKSKITWDNQPCEDCQLSDISEKKLKIFLKSSGKIFGSVENSLQKLRLIRGGKILNSAIALFGKKPENIFPNLRLRCAVFGTKDTSMTIDMQDFFGDLFYLIEEAEKYVLKNIHIGMKLEGLKRVDVPEIDKDAIREAIINAFCHRDYCKYDSVNVAVFPDRVEVRSPGLLYGGLTVEKIRGDNVSERRNELIAEMFHQIHLVEKWGRGISLILAKEPKTEFKEVGEHFIVVFWRRTPQVTPQVTPQAELTPSENNILKLIQENPRISRKQMADKLKISPDTIKEYLEKLKTKKVIKRIGRTSSGYWEIL